MYYFFISLWKYTHMNRIRSSTTDWKKEEKTITNGIENETQMCDFLVFVSGQSNDDDDDDYDCFKKIVWKEKNYGALSCPDAKCDGTRRSDTKMWWLFDCWHTAHFNVFNSKRFRDLDIFFSPQNLIGFVYIIRKSRQWKYIMCWVVSHSIS